MKKITVFLSLALALLFLCAPISAFAADAGDPDTSLAEAVWLSHVDSGTVAYSKNADERVYAGSTVKIMAGLLFCEQLARSMDEFIPVSAELVNSVSGRKLYSSKLKDDDTVTVEQALYAAVCGSYNDMFYVLAEYLAGSTEAFVEQMNARAKELGLSVTSFSDPSGIDDGSVTTAREMAQLALVASNNTLFMTLSSAVKYDMDPTEQLSTRTVHNANALISANQTTKYYNKECKGLNAGETSRAGNCVVTLSTSGGQTYISVVLGGKTDAEGIQHGYRTTNRILSWVYSTYSFLELVTAGQEICKLPVTVSDMTQEVAIVTGAPFSAYLPAAAKQEGAIQYSIRLDYDELEAPFEEGRPVGHLVFSYQGRSLGSVELYTAEGAERSGFIGSLMSIQNLTKSRAARAGIIFFVVGLVLWIAVECILTYYRRHRWDKYFSHKAELPPDAFPRVRRRK